MTNDGHEFAALVSGYEAPHPPTRGFLIFRPLPSASTAAAPDAAPQKPNHKQKQHGANGGVDDRGTSQVQDFADEMLEIADECSDMRHARHRIGALRLAIARMTPRKYGNR